MLRKSTKTAAVLLATIAIAGVGLAIGCGSSNSNTEEYSTLAAQEQSVIQDDQNYTQGQPIPGVMPSPLPGNPSGASNSQFDTLIAEGLLTEDQSTQIAEMLKNGEKTPSMDRMAIWDSAVTAGILTQDEAQKIQEYLRSNRTIESPPESAQELSPNGPPEEASPVSI